MGRRLTPQAVNRLDRPGDALAVADLHAEEFFDGEFHDTLTLSRCSRPVKVGHGILLHGVGNKPANKEVDVSLIYGDYYCIEAIQHRQGERGDVNGDLAVTLADLRLLLQMLLGQAEPNDAAKTLAAPATQVTLGDALELIRVLVN